MLAFSALQSCTNLTDAALKSIAHGLGTLRTLNLCNITAITDNGQSLLALNRACNNAATNDLDRLAEATNDLDESLELRKSRRVDPN